MEKILKGDLQWLKRKREVVDFGGLTGKMKKATKHKINTAISFFAGATFLFFMWLFWKKMSVWIGNNDMALLLTGVLSLIFLATGYIGVDKIANKFQ